MSELYLIFFGVGVLLFGAIVGFSILQKRQSSTLSGISHKKRIIKNTFINKIKLSTRKKPKTQRKQTPPEKPQASRTSFSSKDSIDYVVGNKTNNASQTTQEPKFQRDQSTSFGDVRNIDSAKAEEKNGLSEGVSEESTPKESATIHQAALAPKPILDKDSSSIVTDLVARVKNPSPIEQQTLLAIFRNHDYKFQRKINIYGLNQLTEMWRDIEFEMPSARFIELGVSIQLADREGAMSQRELHDFQQMVLEFTDVFDAPFEFSMDIDDALKQALALDQIGRRYDSMAVLNVVPKSKAGFRIADIESCARDLMMSTDKNGIFLKTSGQKNNITVHFRLACTGDNGQFGVANDTDTPVQDLVLYMNVPVTKDPESVFQEMVNDANSLATWLEGKVVDRKGQLMTQHSYSILMQQVSDIAFSMQQDGFMPGDAVAKKLF